MIGRLAQLAALGRARRPLHRDRGRSAGGEAARARGRRDASATAPAELAGQADELIRRGRNRQLEAGRDEGLRGVVRAAAAAARLRGGRHRGGALPRREAARLAHDRRRRARQVRDAGADAVGRRADRRVAGGGVRAGGARPLDGDRRPHPRRQVRRARADRRARDRGVLHRRARLAPQPGAPPRAAARGGRRARSSSTASSARAASTSAPTRRRRRRSRSSRRSSPCGRAARAARCARRSSGSTSKSTRSSAQRPEAAMLNHTSAPPAGLFPAWAEPPCARAIASTIARPRPAPVPLRACVGRG